MCIIAENRQPLSLGEEEINEMDCFIYLGSIKSTKGGAEEGVKSRIKKDNVAFVQLNPI